MALKESKAKGISPNTNLNKEEIVEAERSAIEQIEKLVKDKNQKGSEANGRVSGGVVDPKSICQDDDEKVSNLRSDKTFMQ